MLITREESNQAIMLSGAPSGQEGTEELNNINSEGEMIIHLDN